MYINFSKIPAESFVGKNLRRLLAFIPRGVVLPIVQGPLMGKKWIVRSGVFGYWLGSYEADKQKIFTSVIKPGDVVYDIGAHVGFYTLLACNGTGKGGRVFSFEPFPQNIGYLKRHIALNRCNAVVIEKGVSNHSGRMRFAVGGNTSMGAIGPHGTLEIETIKLDDAILANTLPAPDVIKMDIEGEEYNALMGLRHTLKSHPPIILLATHSEQLKEQCLTLLRECHYHITHVGNPLEGEFLATVSTP